MYEEFSRPEYSPPISIKQVIIGALLLAIGGQLMFDATWVAAFASQKPTIDLHGTYFILWVIPAIWLISLCWRRFVEEWSHPEFACITFFCGTLVSVLVLVISSYIPQTILPLPFEYIGLSEDGTPGAGELYSVKYESDRIEAYRERHPASMPYVFFFWEGGYQSGFSRPIDDYLYPDTWIASLHFFLACGPPLVVDSCLRGIVFQFPMIISAFFVYRVFNRLHGED